MTDIIKFPSTNYVYFIRAGELGSIKIGHSNNVSKRLEQLQTGCPEPLRLLAKFEHENARAVEQALHVELSDLRHEGEWFDADQRIFDIISAWRVAEGEIASSAIVDIRSSPTRDQLHQASWWVVEWSEKERQTHTCPLLESLSMLHNALLLGGDERTDYQIVAICADEYEAADTAVAIEAELRAVAVLRATGANANSWRRRERLGA